MHFPHILALAFGLAPALAVPVNDPLDISPAAVPLSKLKLDVGAASLKVLKPKPRLTPKVDFALKKKIALNWNDGEISRLAN